MDRPCVPVCGHAALAQLIYKHPVIGGEEAVKKAAAEFPTRAQRPQVPFQTSKRHRVHSVKLFDPGLR